jgi:hypothetical protein
LSEGVVEACLNAERTAGLPRGVLLAVAAQQTGLREGGRAFGISEARYGAWLEQHRGAPPVDEAATFVAGLIAGGQAVAQVHGVDDRQLLRFGIVSAYSGPGAALAGYRRGDVDLQSGIPSSEVVERLPSIQRWLDVHVEPEQHPRLEPGATGEAVVELKRLLREWYQSRGAPPPRRMRGPVYGTAAMEAVKEFQRANDLPDTGVVDDPTWRALYGRPGDRAA